jgi:hypothetical protein
MPSLDILPSSGGDSDGELPLGPARHLRNWRGWSLLSHYWASIIRDSSMVQKGVRYRCAKHPTNRWSVPGRSGNGT